ncbi:hypothetical protein [Thermoanaerobacter wiegelii]|uniref:hypothetical protein n=1 Tax=Thermoanaerobacter wiegelii TaxID=46354 RepID=UPI0001E4FC54|nr:hypothetical protein [Thermoanaerobacter wiegelii]
MCENEIVRLIKLVEQLKYFTDIENNDIKLNVGKFGMTELLNEIVGSFEYQIKMWQNFPKTLCLLKTVNVMQSYFIGFAFISLTMSRNRLSS